MLAPPRDAGGPRRGGRRAAADAGRPLGRGVPGVGDARLTVVAGFYSEYVTRIQCSVDGWPYFAGSSQDFGTFFVKKGPETARASVIDGDREDLV